ncbi:glycosyltransferase [Paraburkholderia xenovorans]|uniref:glycosyltransferase n=1 Tax=Paraburkholderia xenovorans TaxID=36873 RepID=UPI0038B9682B
MKVAIVSPIPLFPLNAGNRSRVLNLARTIRSLGHQVEFIYLESRQPESFDTDAHHEEFGASRVTVLHRTGAALWLYRAKRVAWLLRRIAARVAGHRDGYYTGLDELYSTTFSKQLRRLQDERGFDAVFVEYVFYSRALDAFPDSVIKVLDTHDIFADRHIPFIGRPGAQNYMFSISQKRENDGLRRAQVVLAIQAEEGAVLSARLISTKHAPEVAVLSHLLEPCAGVDSRAHADAAFLASNNQPNRDALAYFMKEVLPRIVAVVPQFHLHLLGGIAGAVDDHPNLIKRGPVKNLADAFASAPISINPMLLGTGINIKLLESMQYGLPVVTTRLGARGLTANCLRGVTVVGDSDAQGFADAVIRLVRDTDHRAAEGAAARQSARLWHDAQLQVLRRTLDGNLAQIAPEQRASPETGWQKTELPISVHN